MFDSLSFVCVNICVALSGLLFTHLKIVSVKVCEKEEAPLRPTCVCVSVNGLGSICSAVCNWVCVISRTLSERC